MFTSSTTGNVGASVSPWLPSRRVELKRYVFVVVTKFCKSWHVLKELKQEFAAVPLAVHGLLP